MSDYFPKAERVAYGLRYEPLILPKIQEFLNDKIMKTAYCFSLLDFDGISTWSELKVRTLDFHYTDKVIQEEGWLIPACKVLEAWRRCDQKDVWFFYLWERDGSLFAMKFDSQYFTTLIPRVPKFHQDSQLHYYVPSEKWVKVADLKIDDELRRSPKQCLILDDV